MKILKTLAAITISVTAFTQTSSVNASTFFAWEVTGVEWNDTLNARRWPAATSQKRAAYPNGTTLSLTGKCKGAPNLLEQISHLPANVQRAAVMEAKWCEIWHDPYNNGEFEPGWIYMKYAKPADS